MHAVHLQIGLIVALASRTATEAGTRPAATDPGVAGARGTTAADAGGCGPLDLTALQALAEVRSDEIHIRQADLLAAQADVAVARVAGILPLSSITVLAGPVPEAHGNILNSIQTNRSLRGFGPFGRVDVNLVQPLWTWGQLDAARDAADAGVRARTHLIDDMREQIRARVIQLYYGVLLTRRLLAIAAEVEGNLTDVEAHVQDALKKGAGDLTVEDKYRVAIFRSDFEQKKAEAEKAQALAHSALAATVALPTDALVVADAALPKVGVEPAPALEPLVADAEKRRPEVLALAQAIRAKEDQAKAARGAILPQLFLAGTFTYSRAPNRDIQTNPWISDPFNQLSIGAALGLRQNLAIPLLLEQAEKAEAEIAPLRRQQEGLFRLIRTDVERAVAELTAASKRHAAARAAVSAGKSWFRAAGMNFGLNVTDAKSLLEAYTGYVKTQIDEAQSAYDVLVARGRLDQVTAAPLPPGGTTCNPP